MGSTTSIEGERLRILYSLLKFEGVLIVEAEEVREANVFNSGQTVLGMFGQDLSYYMTEI